MLEHSTVNDAVEFIEKTNRLNINKSMTSASIQVIIITSLELDEKNLPK